MLLQKKLPLTSLPLLPSYRINSRRRNRNSHLYAADKDSEFEPDRDKAREALKKLDQQLQSLSRKDVAQPKKRIPPPIIDELKAVSEAERARDLGREREEMREPMPEFSDSYLGYTAFTLLAFTILYNFFFLNIIKPSIDASY